METEFASGQSLAQASHELTAKDSAQDPDWKEERVPWTDPACVIGRQSAGWNDAVHVRMVLELLVPRVQHAEESNLCPKMLGIASNRKQCFGAGPDQQIVDYLLVLQSQRGEFVRQSEHDMDVADG